MRRFAIGARLFTGMILIVCWGLIESPLSGVAYMLVLVALSAIRYRISPNRWLGVLEAAVCIIYAFFWLPALLGLWFPFVGFFRRARSGTWCLLSWKNWICATEPNLRYTTGRV